MPHRRPFALLCITGLVLAGCATPPPPAPPSSSETPFAFVKRRYYTEQQSPVFDRIEKAAKGYARFIDGIQGRESIEPPNLWRPVLNEQLQLVIWRAYYTDLNFAQLTRPSDELRQHCIKRAGQWRVVEGLTSDPLAGQRAEPVASFMNAYQRVTRHLAAQSAYVGFEEMRDAIAQDVGRQMAAAAEWHNRRNDEEFSVAGFRMAQQLQSFGLFECQEPGGAAWSASVLPMLLTARNLKNDLTSSGARLAIRVLPSSKAAP